MLETEAPMLDLINRVLAAELAFEQFEQQFSNYYLEELPEDALPAHAYDFYSRIHEKLEWTDQQPDAESRSYGWANRTEFLTWLRENRDSYRSGLEPT